jgi:hypothetical protein
MPSTAQEVHDRVRGEQLLQLEKEGRAPHPDSPSGRSLLQSYRRWQAGEAAKASDVKELAELRAGLAAATEALEQAVATVKQAQASPALSTPGIQEEAAQAIAEKKMRKALLAGESVAKAIEQGFITYKLEGGKLTEAAWRKGLRR